MCSMSLQLYDSCVVCLYNLMTHSQCVFTTQWPVFTILWLMCSVFATLWLMCSVSLQLYDSCAGVFATLWLICSVSLQPYDWCAVSLQPSDSCAVCLYNLMTGVQCLYNPVTHVQCVFTTLWLVCSVFTTQWLMCSVSLQPYDSYHKMTFSHEPWAGCEKMQRGRTKRCQVPIRTRRRQSDAKWRASVATCYETLKFIIPNGRTLPKRKASKVIIQDATSPLKLMSFDWRGGGGGGGEGCLPMFLFLFFVFSSSFFSPI